MSHLSDNSSERGRPRRKRPFWRRVPILRNVTAFLAAARGGDGPLAPQTRRKRPFWRRVGRLRRFIPGLPARIAQRFSRESKRPRRPLWFLISWERFPQRGDLLWGLPAVLVGLIVLLFGIQAASVSKGEVSTHYFFEGARRFELKEYEAARVCFEHLVLINPSNLGYRFRLALALEALDQHGRALTLMNKLAPIDQPVFLLAHIWITQRLMDRKPPSLQGFQAAERHLKLALKLDPGSIDAQALLGQLYTYENRAGEAEPYLTKVVKARPDLLLLLAAVCKAQGKHDSAQSWANIALQHYRRVVENRPEDQQGRQFWAFAEAYLGRFERAETIIKQGQAMSEGPVLRHALCQVYAGWFDELNKDKSAIDTRMSVLERGLVLEPDNTALLERLSIGIETGGQLADRARASLLDLLAEGKATALVHLILGLDAWGRGRTDEAEVHWEQAYRLSPESPTIVNNLACVLTNGPRPDPTRALMLIDHLIKLWPNVLAYRDTRGFILVKMKRWKDALPDLELALQSNLARPELHLAIAEVYENLKMPEVAAQHRRRANDAIRPGP